MKSLYLVVLLLFAQTATAQEKSPNTSPTDLIIIKYHIGSGVLGDVSRSDPPPKLDDSHQFGGSPPEYEWRVKAELQVQNSGSTSMKSGKVILAVWIRNQSLKTISKQREKGLAKERVDITRIEYADGSIWEGGKSLKFPLTY
jgi:hypothetical protein